MESPIFDVSWHIKKRKWTKPLKGTLLAHAVFLFSFSVTCCSTILIFETAVPGIFLSNTNEKTSKSWKLHGIFWGSNIETPQKWRWEKFVQATCWESEWRFRHSLRGNNFSFIIPCGDCYKIMGFGGNLPR